MAKREKFRIYNPTIKCDKYIVKERKLFFFWLAVAICGTYDEAYNFIQFVVSSRRAEG